MSVKLETKKRVLSCAVFTGFLNSIFWAIAAQVYNSVTPPSDFLIIDSHKFFMYISVVMAIIFGSITGGLIGFLNRNWVESAFIAGGLYFGLILILSLFEKAPSKSEISDAVLFVSIPGILLGLAIAITAKFFNGTSK